MEDTHFQNKGISEEQCLRQHKKDYPDSLAFADIGTVHEDVNLSRDERIFEFELEKSIQKVTDTINLRREIYSSVEGRKELPTFTEVKSAEKQRKLREEIIKDTTQPLQCEHPQKLSDIIFKEVSLSTEPKNSKEFLVGLLLPFYEERLSSISLTRERLLYRWARYCGSTELLARTDVLLEKRLSSLSREYLFLQSAYSNLLTLHENYSSETSSYKDKIDIQTVRPLKTSPENSKPSGPDIDLIRVWINNFSHKSLITRRYRRFELKCKWLAITKRYEITQPIFNRAVEHAKGTLDTTTDNVIPKLALTDEEIESVLEELSTSFKISRVNDDSQEYSYVVNKRFSAIFSSQCQAFEFLPYELAAKTRTSNNRNAADADAEGPSDSSFKQSVPYVKTFLVHSTWLPYESKITCRGKQSPEVEAVRCRLHSNGGYVDSSLRVELGFLAETDSQYVTKRLRDQAATHVERATVASNTSMKDDRGNHSVGAQESSAIPGPSPHKKQALYFLRYIRIREFRRRLLDTLNYYASLRRRLCLDSYGYASSSVGSTSAKFSKKLRSGFQPDKQSTNLVKKFVSETSVRYGINDTESSYTSRILQFNLNCADRSSVDEEPQQPEVDKNDPNGTSDSTDATYQEAAFYKEAELQNRDDTYRVTGKSISVIDRFGNSVMYTVALQDLEDLENELLLTASHYLTVTPLSTTGQDVDRAAVLEDIFESETWFQSSKRKVIDTYMEAYEHCGTADEQIKLSNLIFEEMIKRPLLDLSHGYFIYSYTAETISNELQYSLLRDIINCQIADEKKITSNLYKNTARKDWLSYGGFPEQSVHDTRLYQHLFPGSSVVNVLEFYGSLSSIASVPKLLNELTRTICSKFSVRGAEMSNVKQHILQLMIVEWKVLTEEERVQRQLQGAHLKSEEDDKSFVDDADSVDSIIGELVAENSTDDNSATKSQQTRQLWFDAVEIILNRTALMSELYETEILYNLHRKQGMVCGVEVRRFQFESIDFETRKTVAEIDEFDHDSVDMSEVLALRVEYLSKLAVGEFDQSLAQFDFHTFQGVKRILSFSTLDLRRALTVQVTQRNVLISACLYNQSPIDAHYCQVAAEKIKSSTASVDPKTEKPNTFVTQPEGFTKSRTRASRFAQGIMQKTSAANPPVSVPIKLGVLSEDFPSWPAEAGAIGEQQLQGLFVSVNQIKSTHRRNLLEQLNTRTSEILRAKRPELLRKKMKELKHLLIDDYCLNIITCVIPLILKWETVELCRDIRSACHSVPGLHAKSENALFTFGGSKDLIETTASGTTYSRNKNPSSQLNDGTGRCLVTKDGRIEDAWYIPHLIQVYNLCIWDPRDDVRDFSDRKNQISKDRKAATTATDDGISSHCHSSDIPTSLLTIKYLGIMSSGLHNLLCIVLLCKALSKLNYSSLAVTSGSETGSCFDGVAKEIKKIQLESELLSDPSDPRSVTEILSAAHETLFLKLYLATSGLKKQLLFGKNEKNSAALVDADIEDLQTANGGISSTNKDFENISKITTTSLRYNTSMTPNSTFRAMKYRLDNVTAETALKNEAGQSDLSSSREQSEMLALNNNFYEVLCEPRYHVVPETTRMPWLSGVLLRLSDVDRTLVQQEITSLEQYLSEVRSDASLIEEITSGIRNGGKHVRDQTVAIAKAGVLALQLNYQRDELKTLYCVYLPHLLKHGNTTTLPDESLSDEDAFRMVIGKARTQYELDLQERSDENHSRGGASKSRRKKRTEVGLRRKQVVLLSQEVNKMLLQESITHMKSTQENLNAGLIAAVSHPTESIRPSNSSEQHSTKLLMFNEFHSTVMTRAVTLRQEGNECPVYQIPENLLCLAIDQLGSSLRQWNVNHLQDIAQASDSIIQQHRHALFLAEQRILQTERLRELDKKALSRMVAARFNDEKYNLIHKKNVLQKRTEELKSKLAQVEVIVREAVKSEYDEEVTKLQNEISLLQAQFRDHKKKLYREMQINLEEIKRHAMMSIGKSEIAPLHMKRQALRIAINDEEANKLKEQNSELHMTVTKLKIWYEMRLSRMDNFYQKKIDALEKEKLETSGRYWGDKEHVEEKEELMRQQLHATQKNLSATEMEVEQLLRDLDLQEKKKKHLVAWKVAHSRLLEDVARKTKRYEKYERQDMDKLLRTLEKDEKTPGASKTTPAQPPVSPVPNQTAGSDVVVSKEILKLKEEVRRERRLKSKAFQKLTELREDQDTLTDEMVWQKKYFQCASELQKTLRDVQQYKDHIIQNGITLPTLTSETPSIIPEDRSSTSASKNLPPVSISPELTRVGSAPGSRNEPRVLPRRPSTSTPTQRRIIKR